MGHEYAFSVRLNQVWNVPLSRPSLPCLGFHAISGDDP